jgi:hypothetical protein
MSDDQYQEVGVGSVEARVAAKASCSRCPLDMEGGPVDAGRRRRRSSNSWPAASQTFSLCTSSRARRRSRDRPRPGTRRRAPPFESRTPARRPDAASGEEPAAIREAPRNRRRWSELQAASFEACARSPAAPAERVAWSCCALRALDRGRDCSSLFAEERRHRLRAATGRDGRERTVALLSAASSASNRRCERAADGAPSSTRRHGRPGAPVRQEGR